MSDSLAHVRTPDLDDLIDLQAIDGIEDLTVGELVKRLNARISAAGLEFGESSFSDQTIYLDPKESPVGPYKWLECSAVRGGSEGYYVHIRRVGPQRLVQQGVLIATAKVWTWKDALLIAAAATILLDR